MDIRSASACELRLLRDVLEVDGSFEVSERDAQRLVLVLLEDDEAFLGEGADCGGHGGGGWYADGCVCWVEGRGAGYWRAVRCRTVR